VSMAALTIRPASVVVLLMSSTITWYDVSGRPR
jgi:hypothetical protein